MNIKYTVLALALASATVHADVELKSSDDDSLLINGSTAQLVPHVYDANGQIVDEFKVISHDAFLPKVLLNIGNETIDLAITSNGSIVGNDREGLEEMYNENCQFIGYLGGDNPFYNITATVRNRGYSDDPSMPAPSVYKLGAETIEGWGLGNCNSNSTSPAITGASVTYNPELTEAVNTFMESLNTPLSIK